MKWLKITVVFFLITLVKSGPTRSEEPNPEPEPEPEPEAEPGTEIKISEILRNSVSEFQIALLGSTPAETKRVNLVINHEGESGIDAKEQKGADTYTFLADLKSEAGVGDVSFLLTASDDSPIPLAYAEHHFTNFPEFKKLSLTATRLDDPRKPNTDVILRVEGSLGLFILNKAGTLITGKDNIHYYQETSPDYTPCTEVEGVTICDIKLNPTDLTATTLHDEILSSAVLSYGPDTKATLKLLPIAQSPDKLDAILIPIPPTPTNGNNLCQIEEITGSTCTIDWTESSEDSLQVVLVQKTTGTETWTTTTIDIHDRKLVVNQLGDNIIEGRWLVLSDETSRDQSVKSIYRMKINGDDKVDDIEVDCSHLSIDPKLCFGYFSELKSTKTYTLTVAYKKADTYNEKDQIESSPVTIQQPEHELAILSRHTTRHANQLMADVNICFEHLTPTEGRSFSHYEMLIINEKGQWLKHRIMEEEEEEREGRLCFTPFAINTIDFDLTEGTKVVVSQRGVDGFTVLATGQSKLL